MSSSGAILSGIVAVYTAPALLALSRGNYGRAAVVFLIPIAPLLTAEILPSWLVWLMFLALWIPLSVWASKKEENKSETSQAEAKSSLKDKLEMIKWLSIVPLSIAAVIALIIVFVRLSK